MASFYGLVVSELTNRLIKWWNRETDSSQTAIEWLTKIRRKYAVWVIEGAYLRHKEVIKKREEYNKEIEGLLDEFNIYLVRNIAKYSKEIEYEDDYVDNSIETVQSRKEVVSSS